MGHYDYFLRIDTYKSDQREWSRDRAAIHKRLAAMAARLDALEGKQQTPAPEPRPKLMYVDDVPADGTVEIRWWNSTSSAWSDWCRVLGDFDARDQDGRRCLRLFDDARFSPPSCWYAMKRDECVQVRPVFDPQTGDTLGEVA